MTWATMTRCLTIERTFYPNPRFAFVRAAPGVSFSRVRSWSLSVRTVHILVIPIG
jgi:hypothetical protein